MKRTNKTAKNLPAPASPTCNDVLATALAAIIGNTTAEQRNALVQGIVSQLGYQVVTDSTIVAPHRKRTTKTDSLYKSNGKLKARAADPIRTKEEFQAIGNYLLTHGNTRNRQRNYTLYICGVTLGLRVSDILKIKIGDVYDISHNTVFDHIHLIAKKNKKPTTDIITPMAANAISNLVEEIRAAQHGVLDPEWPLFQTQKWSHAGGVTKPLTGTQVYRILTQAAEACEVNGHIGTHTMRKTYGYSANVAMANAGIDTNIAMETLQAKLGHRDQTTTLRYIGIQQSNKDALGLAVDAILH